MKKYRPPIACFLVLFNLTSLVYSQNSQIKSIAVFERGKMEAILREVCLQQTGCISPQCMVEAGKMLSVGLMAGGSVGKSARL